MNLLLDTNIVIFYLAGSSRLSDLLQDIIVHLSFITELELLSYPGLDSKEMNKVKTFIKECSLHTISDEIKQETIRIRKKYKLKLPDSIIAATAISENIPLFTADNDFMKVNELSVIDFEY
jgi:predicted nucleic acid-binding protein